jgi:hypothetical protein
MEENNLFNPTPHRLSTIMQEMTKKGLHFFQTPTAEYNREVFFHYSAFLSLLTFTLQFASIFNTMEGTSIIRQRLGQPNGNKHSTGTSKSTLASLPLDDLNKGQQQRHSIGKTCNGQSKFSLKRPHSSHFPHTYSCSLSFFL